MMTSSNGNIFRVTGPLCGEFTGPGEVPTQRPVTRSFDVFFDLHPNKRLSKQWWGWWFETQSCPLWRHRNDYILPARVSYSEVSILFYILVVCFRVLTVWFMELSSSCNVLEILKSVKGLLQNNLEEIYIAFWNTSILVIHQIFIDLAFETANRDDKSQYKKLNWAEFTLSPIPLMELWTIFVLKIDLLIWLIGEKWEPQ